MIRLLIAAAVSLMISLIGTRVLIGFLRRREIGQPIREDGPQGHRTKAGTPTMGGVAIVGAAAVAWLVSDFQGAVYTRRGLLCIGAIVLAGLVGFADDVIKVFRERNLGLNKRAKTFGLLLVAVLFSVSMLVFTNVKTTLSFTRFDLPGWNLSPVLWVVWTSLMVWSTTNAVNVTDGLDGLAAGSALFGFLAFTVIAYWAFRNPDVYHLVNPLDLAVFSAAMAGACGGFLWWNAAPARIFMGDVGALGIGAALGLLAVATNTHLLLPLICALNVMEAGSVALQMGVFKASGRKKRLFRMSPIHHHFELLGWPETTVIIRFWILSGICVAVAVGMFIADFTHIADSFAGR